MTNPIEIHVAQTAAESKRMRDSAADLARFPHLSVVVAHDPDAPDSVVANTDATAGAPCLRRVANMLRGIADELEQHHPPGECAQSGVS